MKTTRFFTAFFCLLSTAAFAQSPLRYTVWADGLINPQLPKSSLYFLGTGARFEVSQSLRNPAHALFAQAGIGHFFQKNGGAFTVNLGLVQAGYRYQSRKAFNASVGLGAQVWSERMRLRLGEEPIRETFNHVLPSASAAIGFRVRSRYRLGLEYRALFKPEPSNLVLRNNLALAVGYTF